MRHCRFPKIRKSVCLDNVFSVIAISIHVIVSVPIESKLDAPEYMPFSEELKRFVAQWFPGEGGL